MTSIEVSARTGSTGGLEDPVTGRGSTCLHTRGPSARADTSVRRSLRVARLALLSATVFGSVSQPEKLLAQSTDRDASTAAPAQTPVDAAERFFDAIGGLRWSAVAASVHDETLDLFRFYVTSIVDADETGDFAEKVLGTRDRGEIRARSPDRMFADLVKAIYEDTPALIEVMATNSYAFLGHVSEGDTLAHVVARVTPYTNGSAPTKLTTVTVKRARLGWRVLGSPELEALSTAMRGLTFRPGDPAPSTFD